jgi:hypothetical protein
VALAQATIWGHAVQVQGMRVLSDAVWPLSGPVTKQGDAYLFAIALRDVLRAAEFVKRCADKADRPAIRAAIASFKKRLPHATDLRDILEHLDEYSAGNGKLRRDRKHAYPITLWYEHTADNYALNVGLDGRVFRIDVREATEATQRLVLRLSKAVG